MKVGILSALKRAIIPRGIRRLRVPFGLYRGIVLELDLYDRTQLVLGLWERETYSFIRKAVQRCEWVIDVGSGRGELCAFFLKHSSGATVIAVEPSDSERRLMRKNLGLNGYDNSSALVTVDKLIGRAQDPKFIRLDEIQVDPSRRGFIKVDVDGAELEVLESGVNLFRNAALDILVETHSVSLEDDCMDFLMEIGFHCQIIKNAWWRSIIPENRPIGQNRWLWATKPDNSLAVVDVV